MSKTKEVITIRRQLIHFSEIDLEIISSFPEESGNDSYLPQYRRSSLNLALFESIGACKSYISTAECSR